MREPNNTCPTIDSFIRKTENDLLYEIRCVTERFEELRKLNQELREWGQYWKEKAEEYESEIENLELRLNNEENKDGI